MLLWSIPHYVEIICIYWRLLSSVGTTAQWWLLIHCTHCNTWFRCHNIYFFLLLLSFIRLEHIQAENRRRAQAPLCNANRIINVGTVKKKKIVSPSHTLRAEEVYFLFRSPPVKKRTCNNPHHCTRLTWGAELPTSQRKRDRGGEKQKEYGINERMEEERAGQSEQMSLFILNGRKIFKNRELRFSAHNRSLAITQIPDLSWEFFYKLKYVIPMSKVGQSHIIF